MTLKRLFIAACTIVVAPIANAEEGGPRLLGCFQRVVVPAEYHVTKTLIKKEERKYVKRNGRYELLEYPAIYKENKRLIRAEYHKMQEIPCD